MSRARPVATLLSLLALSASSVAHGAEPSKAEAKAGEPSKAEVKGGESSKAEAKGGESSKAETKDGESQDLAWTDFELDGTHAFVGLTIGPGASGWWPYAEKHVTVYPAFFFGVRGGATFDHVELGFELAPVTWIWMPDFENDPNLSLLVTIGGYPELGEHVYWPLRFGLGLTAVNTIDGKVGMQGRVDLLGLAFQYGHLLFEIDLPSTRFHADSAFDTYGIWGWLCNLSVSYFVL